MLSRKGIATNRDCIQYLFGYIVHNTLSTSSVTSKPINIAGLEPVLKHTENYA